MILTDSRRVKQRYNSLAGCYNAMMHHQQYTCPHTAADLIRQHMQVESPDVTKVLDIGCGTGLVGQALVEDEVHPYVIHGLDFALNAIAVAAETGAYSRFIEYDLTQLPTPLESGLYDAVTCIGTLGHLNNFEAMMRECCRLVKAEGLIVFTQRDDVWDSRDCGDVVQRMCEAGLWSLVHVTDSVPYMPGNRKMTDVTARIWVYRKL